MLIGIFGEGYQFYLPEKKLQSLILFIILLLQYLAEHLKPAKKKNNQFRNEGKNVLVGILNMAILIIPSTVLVELLWWLKEKNIGLLHWINIPFWLNILITIMVMDFVLYWWHRANHRIGFLWTFHKFHHLDPAMNTTTALRFHTVELLFSSIMRAVLFLIMGFFYSAILIYEVLFFSIVLFQHSNINISTTADATYRKLFSSPLMHRIHHSNKQEETDTNYSSVFSFWDHLFKSYKKEASGEITFGVEDKK